MKPRAKARKPGTFTSENNPGGKHGGDQGGRPPDWLKKKCQDLIEKGKLLEFLRKVAEGEDIDQQINENGECLKVPASIKDRLRAFELLADRAWGKPAQAMEHSGSVDLKHCVVALPIQKDLNGN